MIFLTSIGKPLGFSKIDSREITTFSWESPYMMVVGLPLLTVYVLSNTLHRSRGHLSEVLIVLDGSQIPDCVTEIRDHSTVLGSNNGVQFFLTFRLISSVAIWIKVPQLVLIGRKFWKGYADNQLRFWWQSPFCKRLQKSLWIFVECEPTTNFQQVRRPVTKLSDREV